MYLIIFVHKTMYNLMTCNAIYAPLFESKPQAIKSTTKNKKTITYLIMFVYKTIYHWMKCTAIIHFVVWRHSTDNDTRHSITTVRRISLSMYLWRYCVNSRYSGLKQKTSIFTSANRHSLNDIWFPYNWFHLFRRGPIWPFPLWL